LLLGSTKAITSLQAAASLVCDIVITVGLFIRLQRSHTTVKSTNTILHKLTIYAVNRGVLTALAAALNLILFLAIPSTFYFFLGLILSGKLYMNSVMATLNTRQYISSTSKKYTPVWESMHLDNMSTAPPSARKSAQDSQGITVDTVTALHFEEPALPDHQKSSLIPEMT
jgi:hypothetical protein